jgi:type III pantothenate kinase
LGTLLAIDAGNTNVVIGAYRGPKLIATWRTATDHDRTEDELAVTLDALLGQEDLSLEEMDALVLGSVVPPLTQAFTRLADRYMGGKAVVIGPGIKTGVRLRVDNPSEVGADRIANTLAAHRRYGGPAIVVDFGTTTNFDVVNADGDFIGRRRTRSGRTPRTACGAGSCSGTSGSSRGCWCGSSPRSPAAGPG